MYCKKCGQEINDEAVVCPKCGCSTSKNDNEEKYNESKTSIGILMGLFLGVIGLVIGMVLYPEGTIARKTFMKSWLITFLICIGIGILFGIIMGVVASSIVSYGYSY